MQPGGQLATRAPAPARAPARIQRSRRRGAKTPAGAVYVGRPTLFTNPFRSDRFGHARATRLHRDWLDGRLSALGLEGLGYCPAEVDTLLRLRARVRAALPRLAGRDLECHCPLTSRWCHADTLLRLAAACPVDGDSAAEH